MKRGDIILIVMKDHQLDGALATMVKQSAATGSVNAELLESKRPYIKGEVVNIGAGCYVYAAAANTPLQNIVRRLPNCRHSSNYHNGGDCTICGAIGRASTSPQMHPNAVAEAAAFGFGYRCCEKGMNLEMALSEFRRAKGA